MAFTYFFRDAQTLEVAVDQTLPNLLGRAFIDVWDAGCAHGPEPYTLAILLRERLSDDTSSHLMRWSDHVRLFHTHIERGA